MSLQKSLVHDCLKLWVACRFIEKPWHLVGSELLGMQPDPDPNSPYHAAAPVTPIMDQEIDNLVIHNILQPLRRKITQRLDKLRVRFKAEGKKDCEETQLAYFILMNNVELAMAHDVAFARRYHLASQFSNTILIKMLAQGANTLLKFFHQAHQGYAAHSEPWSSISEMADLGDEQKEYLKSVRNLTKGLRGEHMDNPAREFFWTSQLFDPSWHPVLVL